MAAMDPFPRELRPLPLARQLDLVEIIGARAPRAVRVSRILALAFDVPLGTARARSMSARAQALVTVALSVGTFPAWFVATCRACRSLADVSVARGDFSPEPARWPAPEQEFDVGPHTVRFRPLDGRDEEIVAGAEHLDARRLLARAAIDAPEGAIKALDPAEAETILEALAPDKTTPPGVLPLSCPSCGAVIAFHFDALDWIGRHLGEAVRDVATLARAYGWSEADVCRLGPLRRSIYLRRVHEGA